MTIEIKIECDALRCHNYVMLEDYTDADVTHAGWFNDPVTQGQHYCPKCWPKVKKENPEPTKSNADIFQDSVIASNRNPINKRYW